MSRVGKEGQTGTRVPIDVAQEGKTEGPVAYLRQAAREFNKNPFNPEAVTSFWKAFWQVPRGKEGFTFDIAPLSATEEQLKKLFINIRGRELRPLTICIPEELKGKEGLIMLGKVFPELGSYSVQEDTPIEDEDDKTGYIRIEGIIDPPNLNTNEGELGAHFKSQGAKGQRLRTYIIASRAMKLLKGKYLDQSAWSRLPGSLADGRVVSAFCHPSGFLYVYRSLHPRAHFPHLGGRSEEVL